MSVHLSTRKSLRLSSEVFFLFLTVVSQIVYNGFMTTHINSWTKEKLANTVEVCPACHLNFLTTEAGDKHRTGKITERRCLTAQEAKLIKLVNVYGSIIWKRRTESHKGYSLA